MNSSPKKETRIQRLNRQEIIDAAIDLIAESGFQSASMETIAEKVGISRSSIHYYFRKREDLHRNVLKYVLETWDGLWLTLDCDRSPEEVLTKYIRGKLQASWKQPKLSKVFAAEIMRGGPIVIDLMKVEMLEDFEKACTTLQNWMDEGYLIEADPSHIFISIWGATQYYADFNPVVKLTLNKDELDEEDFEHAANTVVQLLIKGIMK